MTADQVKAQLSKVGVTETNPVNIKTDVSTPTDANKVVNEQIVPPVEIPKITPTETTTTTTTTVPTDTKTETIIPPKELPPQTTE